MAVGVVKSLAFADGVAISGTVGVGSGSGEKNYVTSPSTYDAAASSSVVGWYISGGTASTTTTSLPRGNTTGSAILFLSTNSGDYLRYRFALDTADLSKKLKIVFSQIVATAGDFKLEVYYGSDAALTGATRIYTSTDDTTPQTLLTAGTFDFATTFDTNTNGYIEVRWVATGSAKTLKLSDVVVGPGRQIQGAIITAPIAYTPATSNGLGTLGTCNMDWRRVGDKLHISGKFVVGTVTVSQARLALPSGCTVATPPGGSTTTVVGKWSRSNSTTNADKNGTVIALAGATYMSFTMDSYAQNNNPTTEQNGTACFANADTVFFDGEIVIPIAEWAGSNVQNIVQPNEEYVFNSSTNDANDTTSFASGAGGAQFIAVSASRSKTVQFSTPIQATDKIFLEVSKDAGVTWQALTDLNSISTFCNAHNQNDQFYGMGWNANSATKIDVWFNKYRIPSQSAGAGFGTAGADWSGVAASATYKWRVRRVSSGQPVGFSQVGQNVAGLVKSAGQLLGTNTNDSPATGYVGEILTQSRLRSAATAATTATTLNVLGTALTLTPGDWDVTGYVGWTPGATTSVTSISAGISTSAGAGSATLPAADTIGVPNANGELRTVYCQVAGVPPNDLVNPTLRSRIKVAAGATVTVYLVGQASFTISTMSVFGSLTATRAR